MIQFMAELLYLIAIDCTSVPNEEATECIVWNHYIILYNIRDKQKKLCCCTTAERSWSLLANCTAY